MPIDHPHGGDAETAPDPRMEEAKRLSKFYTGLQIKVYQATDRLGRAIGVATVVKDDAQELARQHNSRVHIFEDGFDCGYA